jgi:hypothetical protein
MVELTDWEEQQVLWQLDYLLDDEDAFAIEISEDASHNPVVNVSHKNPSKYNGPQVFEFNMLGHTIFIPIICVPGREISPDIARKDQRSDVKVPDDNSHIGMGGIKIVAPDGSWGTAAMSLSKVLMETQSQRCRRNGSVIMSNSHVLDKRGLRFHNRNGLFLGATGCLFNLNGKHPVDYGHINWTANVNEANKFRVYDARSGKSIRIHGFDVIKKKDSIHKSGARTGWSSGKVRKRKRIKLRGYKGRFDCWQGSYHADFGDSGSPVIRKTKNRWRLVGFHFAENSHFFGFDDVGLLQTGGASVSSRASMSVE